jgi:hypothetical protein
MADIVENSELSPTKLAEAEAILAEIGLDKPPSSSTGAAPALSVPLESVGLANLQR